MKKKVSKNEDGTEKVEYQLKQRAELKFPAATEGHEVSTWCAADNQWMKYGFQTSFSGKGKTDLEFKMENKADNLEASVDMRAGGYEVAGIAPYSAVNLLASCDKASKAMSYELAWSECVTMNSFAIGFENVFNYEDSAKTLTSSIASMAWNSPFGLYWLGGSWTGKNCTFNGSY